MKRKGRMVGRTNKSQLVGCATVVRAGTESNGYPSIYLWGAAAQAMQAR